MKVLDLFCGAGGASMGFHQAGFECVGVDIERFRRYPFEFFQADALQVLRDGGVGSYDLRDFDFIHASPPCQAFSRARKREDHPDLLRPTRDLLVSTGVPWEIENVGLSPMNKDLVLCGTMFPRLGVRRHRWFEFSFGKFKKPTPPCDHTRPVVSVYGHSASTDKCPDGTAGWAKAMAIDWMTSRELAQAIPPPYTHWIGSHLYEPLLKRRSNLALVN